MRISDWSSDVCSSDLRIRPRRRGRILRTELLSRRDGAPALLRPCRTRLRARDSEAIGLLGEAAHGAQRRRLILSLTRAAAPAVCPCRRSEERRVGKECVQYV